MNNNLQELIPFHKPYFSGNESEYLTQAMSNHQLSGDGPFTKKCHQWFEKHLAIKKALLTTSCTHALEIAAILLDLQPNDEIIMPSYTFVSTANAFALRGAKIIFIDIHPDTMNIDETKIEKAITAKTKAIVPVHYAGVACEMDTITTIAKKYNLFVIEDAAQGITSTYKGKPLGRIGDLGVYSFHDTKNITCGEGGVLLINNPIFAERAEIIREKGTNRSQFFRGQIDKYTWKDIGSSYLPSELNAAILLAQLEKINDIQGQRHHIWSLYYQQLKPLEEKGLIELPKIPTTCLHNAHIFFFKVINLAKRQSLLSYLKEHGINAVFHYVPLHSSEAGLNFGQFHGIDQFTTNESERLIRLPLYHELNDQTVEFILKTLYSFFNIDYTKQ